MKKADAESSTTRKFGGTGLGLSISKNIVEMMDGCEATRQIRAIDTAKAKTTYHSDDGERLQRRYRYVRERGYERPCRQAVEYY